MKRYKIWFELGRTRFAMEFEGDKWADVKASAHFFAKRVGASFNGDYEEITQ